MLFFFCSLFLGIITVSGFSQELHPKELALESIHVLKNYQRSFDLSGIAKIEDGYYVVSDNQFSKQLYKIHSEKNHEKNCYSSIKLYPMERLF